MRNSNFYVPNICIIVQILLRRTLVRSVVLATGN